MSTYIYRDDVVPYTLRVNLASNPLPASADGWTADPSAAVLEYLEDDVDGLPCLQVTDPAGGSGIRADLLDVHTFEPQLGQWVAFGVDVKALDADTAENFWLYSIPGGITVYPELAHTPVTTTEYTRITYAAEVTAHDGDPLSYVRVLMYPAAVATPGNGWRFRRAVAAVADTEGEALAAVSDYFDGDTPPDHLRYYEWEGEPHASRSLELEPSYTRSPTLVLDYEHERNTGVTAHDTVLGGAPIIVRLPDRRAQRGTLEMFCQTEQLALDVADICDGRTNVHLVSDDVPRAPYVFAPLDGVRLRYNDPYASWTVSVPYVRTSS